MQENSENASVSAGTVRDSSANEAALPDQNLTTAIPRGYMKAARALAEREILDRMVADAVAAERVRVVEWLRKTVGAEVMRMMLSAGLPGGTQTQRAKRRAYAEGCAHAVSMILEAVERGDHLEGARK